jgi:hypothetical protein
LAKKNFDEIPSRTVNEGSSVTKESVGQSVHFHAESSFAECIIAAGSCFLRETESITTTELA